MKETYTIISYPSSRDSMLLSLTESRSRYMLPFGGRFRVVDFTLRNSFSMGAEHTLIYSNINDGLAEYVERYGPFDTDRNGLPSVKVASSETPDIRSCRDLALESGASHYILYNGDNPSIIDFSRIIARYKKKSGDALLFLIDINDRASMANKLLVASRKRLMKALNRAVKEDRHAPNIFEMVINMIINDGIPRETYRAHYWPVNNIPDYYNVNRDVIWNPELFSLLFRDRIIQSKIMAEGYAHIDRHADVVNSFMSDYCHINGRVENSIIYPGVVIEEKAVIRDSIILPFARIGQGARITRCVVDESTDGIAGALNVGPWCNVGTLTESLKNNDFPQSVFSSVTLLGKNCRIPERSNIGGACYVASGLGADYFTEKRYLYDGLSVVK